MNIWLRACKEEILEPIKGKISGIIPKWIDGGLIINGPGLWSVGNHQFQHLFDCSSLLHRFAIKDGEVTYQCRFLQSDIYKKNKAANRIVATGFGTKAVPDPCQSIFDRIATVFSGEKDDNSMVSIYPFGDELYALGESPVIHRIRPKNLETEKIVDLSGNISIVHHTAHPHVTKDGSVYNIALTPTITGVRHAIVKFPKGPNMFDKAFIVGSIPSRWPLSSSYMHSFGLTSNYFVLIEQPLSISFKKMGINKITDNPIIDSFVWPENEQTQFSLISRDSGELVQRFFSNSFVYFHIINQFEIDNHLVIDICTYQNPKLLDCLYLKSLQTMYKTPNYNELCRSKPLRFVLPLNPDENQKNLINLPNTSANAVKLPNGDILVEPELLLDIDCEVPRINYNFCQGLEYRYFYAISAFLNNEKSGSILKVDTVTKTCEQWSEEDCQPNEPIFLPNPESKFEDDGVVLASVLWEKEKEDQLGLIVLNAETFEEIGRAVFETKSPMPRSLHGWFLHNTI